MWIHSLPDSLGDLVGGSLPDFDQSLILLLFSEQAAAVVPLSRFSLLQCLVYDLALLGRYCNVGYRNRVARARCVIKTDILDPVGDIRSCIFTNNLVELGYQIFQAALVQNHVHKLDCFGQDAVENDPTDGGLDDALLWFGKAAALIVAPGACL